MNTLLLDRDTWDLVIDSNGSIAVASDPYSVAQDAASAARTFLGEVWYDTTLGIPYFQNILGQAPPLSFMRAQYVAAAMSVPGVTKVQVFFTGLSQQRVLTGQIQVNDTNAVAF